MQQLIELSNLINTTKLKSDGLWSIVLEPASKMEDLFEALQHKQVKTDEEAIDLLYPGSKGGTKYHNLKERLKERLLNVLFLLDFQTPSHSVRQKAYFDCNKKWSTAMILLSKNAKLNGIGLLEDLLHQSLHFEFTDLTINALSALRLHHGTVSGDPVKYKQYRDMYRQYQSVLLMENEAEDAYTQLVSHFVNSKATQTELSEEAARYFEQIQPYMAWSDSFRLHLCGRLIEVAIYSSRNDYASTARVCEEAISFFRKKDYESSLPLQAFYYQLLVCYVQLREFKKGWAILDQYQAIFDEGFFNWFKLQEIYFLLTTYTAHYEEAYHNCAHTLSLLRSSSQPAHIHEMWKIYEAYVYFLVRSGKIKTPEAIAAAAKFRLSKFLNEIPVYSKDKRGMNIPILIIQILYNFTERNFDQSIDRMEAIEKYCSRYLKQDNTYRSHCFIKMLLQIPAAAFHREVVVRKTDKLLQQLQSKPVEVAYQAHEIEIIPYEDLWALILETLNSPPGKRL